jgi:DNA-binding YbaB/EbfC family protein
MFGDLFGKLQEAQEKMKDSKGRLALITVAGEAGGVKVTVTGNREVKSVDIEERLLEKDNKEELEDLVITAMNRALKNAEEAWEAEMKGVAGGMMGGLF